MSAQLEAAMRLRLEDLLSEPLAKIEQMLNRIADMGKRLSMDHLTESMKPAQSAAQRVVEQVTAIGEAATSALPDIDALAEGVTAIGDAGGEAAAAADALTAVGDAAGESSRRVDGLLTRLRAIAGAAAGGAAEGIAGAGGFISGTPGRLREVGSAADELGGAAMKAGMTGFGLIEPVRIASEFENTLRHMAITAGLTGDAVDKFIQDRGLAYEHLALATGTKSADVAEAGRFLSSAGIHQSEIDQLLPAIAKASTAYDTPVADAGQMVFSLAELMKITPEQMPGTLSAMALAGKSSHFSFADLSTYLPEIASRSAALGIVGREGANETAAMLATARRHAGTSGEAATNFKQFLTDITAPRAALHFRKQDIDLGGIVHKAMAEGLNPAIAVINKLHQIAPTADPVELGKLFGNQESQTFVQSMLQDHAFYKRVLERLQGASSKTIDSDFGVADQGKKAELNTTFESSIDLARRMGDAFNGPLLNINTGLGWIVQKIEWLDQKSPGTFNTLVGGLGSVVAFGVGMSVLGHAIKLVNSGMAVFGLEMSAARIGLAFTAGQMGLLALGFETIANSALLAGVAMLGIGALVVGAVALIYVEWDRFKTWFAGLWEGIKQIASGFGEFLAGVFTLDIDRAIAGVGQIFGGLGTMVKADIDLVKGLFNDLVNWIDGWTAGAASRAVHGVEDLFSHLFAAMPTTAGVTVGGHTRAQPDGTPGAATTVNLNHQVSVHVTTDNPNVQASATVRTTRASTPIAAPNRGQMLGRP